MDRFTGTVERLCPVDVAPLILWLSAIPFEEWPQQSRLEDGQLRPAMVTDLNWHGFGMMAGPLVDEIEPYFPGCTTETWMLSVVMPGHGIEPHIDRQRPEWVCRVHMPIVSNPRSAFIVGGVAHVLEPGWAYRVDTEAEHSVANDGATPRIHFMADVRNL